MLSAVLRRSTFAAQRVLQWAHPPQRCWTSTLTGASGGSAFSCSSKRDSGHVKPPRASGLLRTPTLSALFEVRGQCFSCSAVKLKKRARPEPPPRQLGLVRYDMEHLWKGPKPALILGFAGLIPFVCPTYLMAATETYYPDLVYAQLAYAASIVSFLGGARWGFALPECSPAKPDWINLANSVVPALFASIAMLMCDTIIPAITMAIMGLGIALHYDLSLLPTYPSWFKALRTVLTIVAFLSLLGTLTLNGVYPEKNFF
ncbi:transmembrane protein 69 [Austrofundulus limnaeus]|uniref:Transmembrane protein 69-like n=1 Tax=Austrofundulus limnaeus TaxID=52670 RepID=A0A2I4CBB6_AUSLI|nr:PREDICTED: transmembrane protein 69-like [Austrofundulus limnaeus]XP_013877288.1 PREDICTED: transmembrane protein 69-like [Austrofundulus limnaeus]